MTVKQQRYEDNRFNAFSAFRPAVTAGMAQANGAGELFQCLLGFSTRCDRTYIG